VFPHKTGLKLFPNKSEAAGESIPDSRALQGISAQLPGPWLSPPAAAFPVRVAHPLLVTDNAPWQPESTDLSPALLHSPPTRTSSPSPPEESPAAKGPRRTWAPHAACTHTHALSPAPPSRTHTPTSAALPAKLVLGPGWRRRPHLWRKGQLG
jgi:hypothetical protein